jgi:hypothetical protein
VGSDVGSDERSWTRLTRSWLPTPFGAISKASTEKCEIAMVSRRRTENDVSIFVTPRRTPVHWQTKEHMSATLRLTREGRGIELRRGRFEISVDRKTVGSLDYHGTVEIPVEPGHHTLQIRAGRYSSEDQSFDVDDCEVVNFRLHGAMIWPRYVASIVKPDLAIALKRE